MNIAAPTFNTARCPTVCTAIFKNFYKYHVTSLKPRVEAYAAQGILSSLTPKKTVLGQLDWAEKEVEKQKCDADDWNAPPVRTPGGPGQVVSIPELAEAGAETFPLVVLGEDQEPNEWGPSTNRLQKQSRTCSRQVPLIVSGQVRTASSSVMASDGDICSVTR